jgi:hypothetical protein
MDTPCVHASRWVHFTRRHRLLYAPANKTNTVAPNAKGGLDAVGMQQEFPGNAAYLLVPGQLAAGSIRSPAVSAYPLRPVTVFGLQLLARIPGRQRHVAGHRETAKQRVIWPLKRPETAPGRPNDRTTGLITRTVR